MQGLILAAGMGKRLKDLTANNAKCMVKVNEVSLVERALRILDNKNLKRIVIVIGYEGANLKAFIDSLKLTTPIVYIDNTIYDKTNNIYSLLMAKKEILEDDTLLLESDIIFEEAVIDALLNDQRPTLALVDKFESWMDGTCVVTDDDDKIVDFVPGKLLNFDDRDKYYKTVNIYKFSTNFLNNVYIPFLEAYQKAMGVNEYYESVIKYIAMLDGTEIRACKLNGQKWYEIDDRQDLDIATTLFADDLKTKYELLAKRYGGYWRYPGMLDFCYLVNPYFPPKKMTEEIKSNFETLMSQYPSGMDVNSMLAAKYFGIKKEHVLVGNGAAELIKSLMEKFDDGTKKLGYITPTFEEYHHRFKGECVVFNSADSDFKYNEDTLIEFFNDKNIDVLTLINPDNPSGNYISFAGVKKLITWATEKKITLIVDESFLDFASDNLTLDKTLLTEEILSSYNSLYVVKSISKSYGVPGFRLGVLASGNAEMIAFIKKDVAIWNINSFGEFYMQICEKYKKNYISSLQKITDARETFIADLKSVNYVKVYDSQANFVMCELLDGVEANALAQYLLDKNIMIKVLTSKISNGREYVRLAVRTNEENAELVAFMKEYK